MAAAASARLGLTHNPIDAVAATRDKAALRARLGAGAVAQPDYRVVAPGQSVAAAAAQIGYPCVVKPVSRSGSQGVIRVETASRLRRPRSGFGAIVGPGEPVLVEGFVAGAEVAVEGLLVGGVLEVLAVFDKPDPLDGPFFEETIYVTPSRQPAPILAALAATVAAAAAAVGLREGPVHAELRVGADGRPVVIEVAARSIGGLCARALRFGAGVSLEEVIVRHAVGAGLDGLRRETQASGVMMLPIRAAGVLDRCPVRPRPWPSTAWSASRSPSPPVERWSPCPRATGTWGSSSPEARRRPMSSRPAPGRGGPRRRRRPQLLSGGAGSAAETAGARRRLRR